jgi:hypothetical protein
MAPPAPRKSRVGLWILLGCVAMLGSCGVLAAFLPDVPETGAAAKGDDDAAKKTADGESEVGALRKDTPKEAAQTIKKARDAIRAGDFDQLQTVLAPRGTYAISGELEANNPRAAIDGWRTHARMVKDIDAALAAKCEVDPPEDGQIFVTCGDDQSGSVFVMLSNMVDEAASEDRYSITGVGLIQ